MSIDVFLSFILFLYYFLFSFYFCSLLVLFGLWSCSSKSAWESPVFIGEAKDEGREGGGEAATPVAKPHKGAARWRDAVGLGFLRKSMVVSCG